MRRDNINIGNKLFNREISGKTKANIEDVCYVAIWQYPGHYNESTIKEFFRGDHDTMMRQYLPPGIVANANMDAAKIAVIGDIREAYEDQGKTLPDTLPSNLFWIFKVKGKDIDIHRLIQTGGEGFGSKIIAATNADGSKQITKQQVLQEDSTKAQQHGQPKR